MLASNLYFKFIKSNSNEILKENYCFKKMSLYQALSHPPTGSTEPSLNLYRDPGKWKKGFVKIKAPFSGLLPFNRETGKPEEYSLDPNIVEYRNTKQFKIAYTQWGDKGPIILFLHGVPSNRDFGYYEIQKRVSPFCRTVSIDMLGMGESDSPRDYGVDQEMPPGSPLGSRPWDWVHDVDYVDQVMKALYDEEKFYFFADDWGSGINSHYAAKYNNRLLGFIQLDPIHATGYPVAEIQAIGRASLLDDQTFMMAMGAADQTIIQILKTMVYNSAKFNQYTYRPILKIYVDMDYERSAYEKGEDASSLTLRLKFQKLRVLADRAAILSPALLLPYDPVKNPKGVKYDQIDAPTLILWGADDNMMPAEQVHSFANIMPNSSVNIVKIKNAGHFAGFDQPDIVAENILNFIRAISGVDSLADIFLGFTGIWQGNEEEMINDLRRIYGINVKSKTPIY